MTRSTAVGRVVLCLATVAAISAIAEPLDERPVDADTRAQVIEGVLKQVEAHYVFPAKAKAMVETIRANERAGEYAMVTSSYHLATTLTQDLQSASHDKHLRVIYGKPGPHDQERRQEFLRRTNFGFAKAEVLAGNIGYLDVHFFAEMNEPVAHAMAVAMEAVANSDALIIDMRQNGGGSPATVAALASYFFDKRTLVNRIYWRDPERTEDFWTVDVQGPKYGETKPIFVLTSASTRSGGEEFCYDLQTRKRATIVGEVTWGGANPSRGFKVSETFAVLVPVGRALNPVTGTNWEGVGISPDVRVPSDKALAEAIRLAARSVPAEQ